MIINTLKCRKMYSKLWFGILQKPLPSRNFSKKECLKYSPLSFYRLIQYEKIGSDKAQVGIQISPEGPVIEVSGVHCSLPNTVVKLLAKDDCKEVIQKIIQAGRPSVPFSDVKLLPPITNPDKVICVALNYREMCKAFDVPISEEPIFFNKFPSSIVGPFDEIDLPETCTKVDYGVELAVVIGKKAKCVEMREARDYIFGYTIAQDISERHWQKKKKQVLLAKSMDTFCPIGPAIVPKEQLKVKDVSLCCSINGVQKQVGFTSDMIFGPEYLVWYLSKFATLYPGDLILTGTPEGTGQHKVPVQFLKKFDVIKSEIEGIGKICNKCV